MIKFKIKKDKTLKKELERISSLNLHYDFGVVLNLETNLSSTHLHKWNL